jgi:hypothetical protein
MSEYRYLFADLLTNQVKAELPLASVSFGQELNTSGSFSGHILLTGIDSAKYDLDTSTTPARTALYVDRDGVIVWAGVLWSRVFSSTEGKLSFQAKEFESYFERRRIDFSYNLAAVAQDQLLVVQNLIRTIQGGFGSNSNIGVAVGAETSGINVTKTYNSFDLKPVTEAIYELSRSTTGFDWNINVAYDGGFNIVKTLELGYPRRGTAYSASNAYALMLEFPGNIIEYTYPEDGISVSNTVYGIGAGSGAGKLISTQTSAGQLSAGWPTLQDSVSYNDYTDATLLSNLTIAQLNAVSSPVVVMTVTLPSYITPMLGTYKTGDDFRIRITDSRFPNGIDIIRRLAKYQVTVGDAGPERVTMSFVVTTN